MYIINSKFTVNLPTTDGSKFSQQQLAWLSALVLKSAPEFWHSKTKFFASYWPKSEFDTHFLEAIFKFQKRRGNIVFQDRHLFLPSVDHQVIKWFIKWSAWIRFWRRKALLVENVKKSINFEFSPRFKMAKSIAPEILENSQNESGRNGKVAPADPDKSGSGNGLSGCPESKAKVQKKSRARRPLVCTGKRHGLLFLFYNSKNYKSPVFTRSTVEHKLQITRNLGS